MVKFEAKRVRVATGVGLLALSLVLFCLPVSSRADEAAQAVSVDQGITAGNAASGDHESGSSTESAATESQAQVQQQQEDQQGDAQQGQDAEASTQQTAQQDEAQQEDQSYREQGALQSSEQDLQTTSEFNAAAASATYGRQVVNINSGWKFTTNDSTTSGWGFPDGRGSGSVDLPHSWEYVHPSKSYIPAFNKKTATYTRTFDVSAYAGQQLFIKFYGVSKNAEVKIDGQTVGTHVGGYSAFAFDITKYVQGKTSVALTVNVTNVDTDSIPINVDYTQWAGIYRDVELIAVPQSHFNLSDYGTNGVYADYALSGTTAKLTVRAGVTNAASANAALAVKNVLTDASGNVVAQDQQALAVAAGKTNDSSTALTLNNAHLWNGTADPYLYTLTTTLVANDGKELDSVSQKIGFRTFQISGGKALLNGKQIQIHGVGYHQDREGCGNAVTRDQIASDIDQMLEMGVNFVRAAHYPHDRSFYEIADEKGLLVYDEIPYYMIYSKASSYGDSIKNQLTEMVRQHYNYPCVVMTGIQNEVIYNSSFAAYGSDFNVNLSQITAFNKELVTLARKEEPKRLIVQATIDDYGHASNTKTWSAGIDLTGLNLYVGFKSALSSAGTQGHASLKSQLNERLNKYKSIYGVGSLMISEYGAGGNVNQHIEVDDSFSWDGNSDSSSSSHYEEYQAFVLETYWDTISSRSDIPVSCVWNMFDFSCYRNEGGTKRTNTKGLLGYDHTTRKDAYYFFKAAWNKSDPFVWLTDKRFTSRNKATQTIKVYSNCDKVELFVNGTSVGLGTKIQDGVFAWNNVKLSGAQANSLRVVATKNGKTYEDSASGIAVPKVTLSYKTHLSNLGWQNTVYAGSISGTTGKGIPVEALNVDLDDAGSSIMLQGHVSDIGWQKWKKGSCGTMGQSKRMEAVRMRLKGSAANDYDIWYRVHSADYGWLDWAKNGAPAGTVGKGKAIEAVQIVLTKKGEQPDGATAKPFVGNDTVVTYAAHVANIGWQSEVSDGATAGTTGRGLSMEALTTELSCDSDAVQLSGHVANIGWQDWATGSCGTTGRGLQLEAVKIKLTGDEAAKYDIYYRVHSAEVGWLGWAKNGERAGTQGFAYGMQAIEIRLVEKGGKAPGSTADAFKQPWIEYKAHVAGIGWQGSVYDGVLAGTVGQSRGVEALQAKLGLDDCSGSIQYRAHVAQLGWQGWVDAGKTAGTTGKSLSIEAVCFRLTGDAAKYYKVRYKVHVQNIGWMDWVEDSSLAGTTGRGLRIEAIKIQLVKK